MKHTHLLLTAFIYIALTALNTADARVVRFVVEERSILANGAQWGSAGPYEKLLGTAYMEVDPADPLNAIVVNLDKAPRNVRGRVEFNAPFVILKPADMAKGNRKIWFGLNNRGNCIELPFHSFPNHLKDGSCNPVSIKAVGANNNLLQDGFTWVDVGWHGDGIMPPDRSKLYASFPTARNPDDRSIVGLNRLEFRPMNSTFTVPFITGFRPYEAADVRTSHATLTVRDRADAPRSEIPADRWEFAACPTGVASQVPSRSDVCLFDGFAPRKIYELIYQAKDPIVMGLAYAVTRDIGSFLRNETHDDAGNPNPLAAGEDTAGIRRAYVSGTSQTAAYLREFLYLGFNEDETHRKVFDGASIYSAGSRLLHANVQFSNPTSPSGRDQQDNFITSDALPAFTFAVTTDPTTGVKDGILKKPATDPLVIQVDEELMFWQRKASLNVTDALGHPVPIPENVRLYHLNGFGHIGAAGPSAPSGTSELCKYPTIGGNSGTPVGGSSLTSRAMVKVLDDWADRSIAPPANNYPMIQNKTLISLSEYRNQFPKIPGLEPPRMMNGLMALDSGGVQSLKAPRPAVNPTNGHGSQYTVLVPRPGPDGTAIAGIDTIFTRAPIGTNVGWNVQTAPRDPDLCTLEGSYAPLARTKAIRLENGDPRLSLEERYGTHQGFVKAVKKAASQLVSARFLLLADANVLIQAAKDSDILKSKSGL